jgi:uncharacterized NAD(P)/FAD-binding protein YdhS
LTAAARRFPEAHIDLHVVEPGRPGGGIYSAPLPDHMILNTPCGQHSLYPFPAEDGEERHGLGFYEWLQAEGYHWEGLECRTGEPGPGATPITPHDFLPRRVMGEYLGWFYEVLRTEAPANVEITHHQACAVDVQRLAGGAERVVLDDGAVVVVDHVIMTTGHVRGHHIKGRHGPWVTEAYPVKAYRDQVRPGEKVAVEGMALTAADVITGLTIGLGGSYVDLGEGRLRYVPSGREPTVYLFSRNGFPYCAKPFGAKDPVGDYVPAICTVDAIKRLKGEPGPKRRMDARAELLPLIFAEMELCYYTRWAELTGGQAAREHTKRALLEAWSAGTFAQERARLAENYGEFIAREHLFLGEGWTYRDSEDYEARVRAAVAADVREALVEQGSPVKMALETLRALRDIQRLAVEFKGLTYESHLDFTANIRGRFARLVAGPPVSRSQQLLALMEAGIVKVPFGPRPQVVVDDDGTIRVRSMHLHEPVEVVVDRLVRAHLDFPSLVGSGSPLINNLVAGGRLRQIDYGGLPAGSVDLTEDFHPVNTDGEPERRLWLFGILTEGSRYFTLYIPSPKSRVRAFMDVGVAVDEIMARAQATVTDGDRQPAQPVEVAAAAGGAGVS